MARGRARCTALHGEESGQALMIFLALVSVLGAITYFVTNTSSDSLSANSASNARAELQTLRRYFKETTSCRDTMSGSLTCTPGEAVSVIGRKGADNSTFTLIKDATDLTSPTRIGRYAVRAMCNAAGTGLDIQAALLKPGASMLSTSSGDFLPNLQTGSVNTFTSIKSRVMGAGEALCDRNAAQKLDCVSVVSANVTTSVAFNVQCPAGYSITGCGSFCNGKSLDQDAQLDGVNNRCNGGDMYCGAYNPAVPGAEANKYSKDGIRRLYARCCRYLP